MHPVTAIRPNPDSKPENRSVTGASWGQERRLEFIEFRLLWDGRINRAELVDFFRISIQQASLDLARYIEIAPGNLEYDKSQKVYRASEGFRPLLIQSDAQAFLTQLMGATAGSWPAALSFLGWRPPYDVVPQPIRSILPQTLMRVLWAIRDREELEISYQSMRNPSLVRRWISPHAIASDGSRWHTRAWCHQNGYFKDFVLARIHSIHGARATGIDPTSDERWHTMATVVLRARRELTVGQRLAVETEFGMRDGKLHVTMRQALVPYFVRQLQLDDTAKRVPRAQTIELVNKSVLEPLVMEAANR